MPVVRESENDGNGRIVSLCDLLFPQEAEPPVQCVPRRSHGARGNILYLNQV